MGKLFSLENRDRQEVARSPVYAKCVPVHYNEKKHRMTDFLKIDKLEGSNLPAL